jgi:predicted RNA-binding protein with PUA-like domain
VHHSSVDPPGVAGVAKVLRGGYPDHTAWTKGHEHEDPKSTKEKPIWSMVDLGFVEKFERVVSLAELKKEPALKGMSLLQTGQRLSVMPVSDAEFAKVVAMGRAVGAKAKSGETESRKPAATARKRRP